MKKLILFHVCFVGLFLLGFKTLAAPLSGSYTINSSQPVSATNFQAFTTAVSALTANGISGPVIFNVAAGTYTGRVVIPNITGVSPVNTITFEGGTGNAASRIISFSGAFLSFGTVQISCPYIALRNLTIQTIGTTYGWGIHIYQNGSTSNVNACKIKNCIINITGNGATSANATNYNGIVMGNSTSSVGTARIDSLEIDSNIINYGYYGITHTATSTNISLQNKFRNNIINNSYGGGINLGYQQNVEISDNTITLRTIANATSRGIYLNNNIATGTSYIGIIRNNRIFNVGQYGISVNNSSNNGSQQGLIVNNVIGGGFQHTSPYGIHLAISNGWNIYHNSVQKNVAGSSIDNAALYIAATDTNINAYNNILAVSGMGMGLPLYVAEATSITGMDYNHYYKTDTSASLIYIDSTFDTSNFAGGYGFNSHSIFKPTLFASVNLNIASYCEANKGIALSSVTTDINGKVRNNPPDIGAYETPILNDNIGIDSLLQPANNPITAGIQNLVVRVKNTGTNPVTSFTINYILNSGSAVSHIWTGSLAPCDTVSVTVPGINLLKKSALTIYTTLPNGNSDTYTENDTLKVPLYSMFNGAYTISNTGTADFISFNEAIDKLVQFGVSGPVVFSAQTGTYTGQIIIPAISGASAANTITFQSAANNADSVTINYSAAANIPIIKLDNTNYINFKFITIASTSVNGRCFELVGNASYDSIIYCKISMGNAGIYANPLSGGKNAFCYNTITGSTQGINLQGSDTLTTDSNVIIGNSIKTNTHGLYLYYGEGTFVANNSIIGSDYGVYNYWSSGQRFYHNTITIPTTGTNFSYGIFVSTGNALYSNNQWKNNIINNSGTNGVAIFVFNDGGINNVWDYNQYYANGVKLFTGDANSTVKDYTSWQATGQDSHSVVLNPSFVSPTDLHLSNGCNFGTSLSMITTDLEGTARSITTPTLGAYEYSGINNIAVDGVFQPDFPIAAGVQNLVVRVKNTGKNLVTSFTINYVLNGGSLVSQAWSAGAIASCNTVLVTIPGINLLNKNVLTIYTTQPNGVSDTYTKNDTLSVKLNTPLNGVYSIGNSGADFNSLNQAVGELILAGISGPVVLNVKSGIYTEQVSIPAINGVSATNTITFKSLANHVDSVVINYAAGNDIPIISLNGANYINFKYITIISTTQFGRAFQLATTASYDSILYCKMSAGNAGVYAYPLLGGKNVFSYNTIQGDQVAFSLRGTSRTAFTDSNVITNNILRSQGPFGCGLLTNFCSNTIVINNDIRGNQTGVNSILCAGSRFYHNTINGAYTTDVQYSIYNYENQIDYSDSVSSNNEWKNNIIISSGTGSAINIVNNGTNNKWDYNLYYTYYSAANLFWGGDMIGFPGSTVVYQVWRAAGQDKHSIVYRPSFTSATNLQPNLSDSASWALNGRGTHLDSSVFRYIDKDINGNPRPTTRAAGVPDIGAYEITPTFIPPLATAVGSLALGSTQAFLFAGDTIAKIKWPVVGVVPDTLEVRLYSGVAPAGVGASQKFMYFYTDVKTNSSPTAYYADNVNIYYRDAWLGTITSEQDLRLIKKSTSNAWAFNGSGLFNVDTAQNIITDQSVSDFGLFTGTDLYNPLPVKLLSFKAGVLAKDVLLTWTTASELNSNRFEVERSIDNKTWVTIGKVKANGNTNSTSNYQLNDADAFTKSNTVFYRLKIVDNNGSFEYSNTVTVTNNPKATNGEIVVYPNPFNNNAAVQLIADRDGKADINMTDISGRNIKTMTVQITRGNNIIPVVTDDYLQSGIYFLSVEVNGEKQVMKIVKQ